MSIPVKVDDLARTLEQFGAGYLLTNHEGRNKVSTVEPTVVGDAVVIEGPGRGATSNLAHNPHCTLVFPPAEPHGFTLIVDGTATVTDEMLTMRPATGVLHRPSRHSDGPAAPGGDNGPATGCENDCQPVG